MMYISAVQILGEITNSNFAENSADMGGIFHFKGKTCSDTNKCYILFNSTNIINITTTHFNIDQTSGVMKLFYDSNASWPEVRIDNCKFLGNLNLITMSNNKKIRINPLFYS